MKIAGSNPDSNPDPDPLVRSMDPRIRFLIHPKMSWIRNTGQWQIQGTIYQVPVLKSRVGQSLVSMGVD
jgi:hypothetical protein